MRVARSGSAQHPRFARTLMVIIFSSGAFASDCNISMLAHKPTPLCSLSLPRRTALAVPSGGATAHTRSDVVPPDATHPLYLQCLSPAFSCFTRRDSLY